MICENQTKPINGSRDDGFHPHKATKFIRMDEGEMLKA